MWIEKAPMVAVLAWLALAACTSDPQYPNCRNDQACQRDGHHEHCVNGHCQQCRDQSDCAQGESCVSNRCVATSSAAPACQADSDCPEGQQCNVGRCVPANHSGVTARATDGGQCAFPELHFAFDDAVLNAVDRDALQHVADCLQREASTRYVLIGRADPRGTTEYNLALGSRRARAVQHFLTALGIAEARLAVSSEGSEGATGHDEAGWAQDRRVDPNRRDTTSPAPPH